MERTEQQAARELPYGRTPGVSSVVPPQTPAGETSVTQVTQAELMAQILTLRQEMAKMQEHNRLLLARVEETQQQVNRQQSREPQSTGSVRITNRKRGVPRTTEDDMVPSKRLIVPAPKDQPHIPKKIYSDCRHRLMEREEVRRRSPDRVEEQPEEPRRRQMRSKSPIRRIQSLESTADSDREYDPKQSKERKRRSVTPTRHSVTRSRITPHPAEDYGTTKMPDRDPEIRLLMQRIQKIEDERERPKEPAWSKLRPGPLTERIRGWRQEKEVQTLRIPFYTGTGDPLTHLHTFQSAVGCKGLSDEGLCLLFPSSLTGAALNWFYRLQPGTVDSFDELKRIFLNHFMIQTDRLYSADDLYNIRQRDDEPLREYAARFSHEYSRCPEADDRAAFGAFKSGLRPSHFRYLVHSSEWRTYDELMRQAAIHAKAEYFNSKPGRMVRQEAA